MNFYYFMQLNCPQQGPLAPMRFIERLGLAYALQRADQAHGVDSENPSDADQERLITVRMDGADRPLRRIEVRDQYNEFLGSARLECMHCPVNKTPQPFGCVGVVPLPLSARAEKWLLDQFAPPEPDKSFFLQHLRLARLPERRHELLLAAPEEFRKSFGVDRPEVTSTQLIYLLLNMRELPFRTRLWLLHEFGVIKAKTRDVEALSEIIAAATEDGAALAASPEMERIRKALDRFKVRMKFEKSDDEPIHMLKQYFLFSLHSLLAGVRMFASLM